MHGAVRRCELCGLVGVFVNVMVCVFYESRFDPSAEFFNTSDSLDILFSSRMQLESSHAATGCKPSGGAARSGSESASRRIPRLIR